MPHSTSIYPPFPDDIDEAKLHRISLQKLCINDVNESKALFDACKTLGFFCLDLMDDVIGQELLTLSGAMFELAEDIFDLDMEEKQSYAICPGKSLVGYKAIGTSKVDSKGSLDKCEFWGISKDDMLSIIDPLRSPTCIQDKRPEVQNFIISSHRIVEIISHHLDLHLQLPPGTLASKQQLQERSGNIVRACKTLPQPIEDRRTSLVPHTDIGAITVLFNILGGLQVLPPGGRIEDDADWRFVRPQPGCVIINMGDAMVKWSNGILRSNMHRVTFPPGAQADFTRYSVGYFSRPTADTTMSPLNESPLIKSFKGTGIVDFIGQDADGRFLTATEWESKKTLLIRQGIIELQSLGGN